MNEEEWLASERFEPLLDELRRRRRASAAAGMGRRYRLLLVAFARVAWGHVSDSACRAVIELAERRADEKVDQTELLTAQATASRSESSLLQQISDWTGPAVGLQLAAVNAWAIARELTATRPTARSVRDIAHKVQMAIGHGLTATHQPHWYATIQDASRPFPHLVRCLYGNPYRPVAFAPAWNTSAVVGLAATVYDERSFEKLPILADALQDAGCDDPDVLRHLRDERTHARGCWVLDGLLGRGIAWK